MSADQVQQATQPAPMKVQRQIKLPFSKAWQITIRSIKIRLGRSLITASGILLGIAFFSSVRASALYPPDTSSAEAISANNRQQWLAIMALLVCFVGITNSMLMSVTERFKEIGTMKCLGALDSFVVKLFFIEATLMGVISSVAGWTIGWLIIAIIHLFSEGIKVFTGAYWGQTVIQAIESIALGAIITLVAAIPPAVRAAKMPAAVALRAEI